MFPLTFYSNLKKPTIISFLFSSIAMLVEQPKLDEEEGEEIKE
jgi:hypothetical protein